LKFGVLKSLRAFQNPFFTRKAVAENGSCSARFLRKQLRCNKTAVCRCALSVKKWSRNARRRFWTTDKNRNSLIHIQSEAEDIFNRLQQKTALPKQSRRDASEDKISA